MKLFAHTYGTSGPQVVLLHGLFGMSDNFHSIARGLQDDHRVHAIDLRNHGRSPKSPEMTYAAMAADVVEYLDASAIPSAIIAGHSMGGKVAMETALRHPGHTLGLFVVDIAPRAYEDRHAKIFDAFAALPVATIRSRKQAESEMLRLVGSPAVAQFLLKNLSRNDDGSYAWSIDHAFLRSVYSLINGPVADGSYDGPALFLRGGKGDYIRDDDLPEIERLFPAARVETVADSGHWVHAEQPQAFLASIRSFVASAVGL